MYMTIKYGQILIDLFHLYFFLVTLISIIIKVIYIIVHNILHYIDSRCHLRRGCCHVQTQQLAKF